MQNTQPDAWAAPVKNHGTVAQAMLLDRLRKAIDDRGTLEVLRVGIDMLGLKAPLKLAQFKPALAMNPDLQARHSANRLRVVRQCRTNHDDIVDLVLFLNGIPVATAELKTDFTQDMNPAVDQHRFDRIPKPKRRPFAEPLLDFARAALIHLAVSNRTLSRLNRAYSGPFGLKDTTYVLDFVNEPDDVLAAFKTYYETAELAGVTDPHLVYDLRAKLDASGHYDDNEVERVVLAELNPRATQAMLVAAIEPVADRLLKRYKAAQLTVKNATAGVAGDGPTTQAAKDELAALTLFRRDLGTFVRVYAFLGQIFDYGNTAIEKRAVFFKRLLPLLDFGREREGVDLSKVVLTHHKLRDQGQRGLTLHDTEGNYQLQPLTDPGTGAVQDKQKVLMSEIVSKVNDLFDGELTDDDRLVYVNHVKGKLLESDILVQQASNNSKGQFDNSPDLDRALTDAIIDAFGAYTTMSKQALDSDRVRTGLKDILLGPAQLYEALRARGGQI